MGIKKKNTGTSMSDIKFTTMLVDLIAEDSDAYNSEVLASNFCQDIHKSCWDSYRLLQFLHLNCEILTGHYHIFSN